MKLHLSGDLDLVFAPDGIETFEDAWKRHIDVEEFPVCHIDDIIARKAAANREQIASRYRDCARFVTTGLNNIS